MANNNSYQLPVIDTISTAWNKVSGAKGTVWAAFGILFLIMFVLGFIEGIFENISAPLGALASLAVSIINLLFQAGIICIGIARAMDRPITYKLMFSTLNWDMIFNIVCLYILKFLIFLLPVAVVAVGVLLINDIPALSYIIMGIGVILAVYLSLRLFIALGFLLDKKVGPVDAIKLSFRATKDNVLNLLGLAILQLCIFIVAMIPLGIGLIWAIPLGLIIYGTVYKRLSVIA